jgi:8-oxo-dGTP pyrophosphatase MutT (NUDIX family)
MPLVHLPAVKDRLRERRASEPFGEEPPAAVATIVREGSDGAEILLIERAERVGDPWSGHLAFPGGKREADESLLRTALRETHEEVGLELSERALLARLGDVVARMNGYRVAQFVFAVDGREPPLSTNGEVTAVLWVPLATLSASARATTFPYVVEGRAVEMPCVHLDRRVLWGMTYRMVQQLMTALDVVQQPQS